MIKIKMEGNSDSELVHHEEADTFDLIVTLNKQNKLMISLRDYTNWAIYEKVYSEYDISGEIHKRMELADVYCAFVQNKAKGDEEMVEQQQLGIFKLEKYQFGSIKMHEGNACYKIEKEGNVTAYLNFINCKTKISAIIQSKLKLQKVRNMTETQIVTHKFALQKNMIFQKFSTQILKINEKLRKSEETIEKMKSTNQTLKSKVLRMPTQKIQDLYIEVDGLKVRCIRDVDFGREKAFVFNEPIFYNQKSKFRAKIYNLTKSFKNAVGIIDYQAYDYRHSQITYGGYYAFKSGDILEIDVDRTSSTVSFSVNGELLESQKNEKLLSDKNRVYAPFIELWKINDSVEWLID